MTTTNKISETIERELLSWPDVTVGSHRFGGREFKVGKREIGHLHGSHVADLPFPRALRDELVARGQVLPHHHLPDSGWVSFYIKDEKDIPVLLALFRLNYERLHALGQRGQADPTSPAADSNPPAPSRSSQG
jgi:hypothetical protein